MDTRSSARSYARRRRRHQHHDADHQQRRNRRQDVADMRPSVEVALTLRRSLPRCAGSRSRDASRISRRSPPDDLDRDRGQEQAADPRGRMRAYMECSAERDRGRTSPRRRRRRTRCPIRIGHLARHHRDRDGHRMACFRLRVISSSASATAMPNSCAGGCAGSAARSAEWTAAMTAVAIAASQRQPRHTQPTAVPPRCRT